MNWNTLYPIKAVAVAAVADAAVEREAAVEVAAVAVNKGEMKMIKMLRNCCGGNKVEKK